jgi:broad specificity phosphatase PhoE
LNNRYFLMRHGHSLANESGKILSNPKIGTKGWGLTEKGRKQIKEGVKKAIASGLLDKSVIVYSSDFSRAWESAVLAAELLGAPSPQKDIRLRERFFGDYEQTSDSNYEKVWAMDKENGANTQEGVESPDHVQGRIMTLIADLEERHKDCSILLVSHGDALQIGQTWFEGRLACQHRLLNHLETGEIRRVASPR